MEIGFPFSFFSYGIQRGGSGSSIGIMRLSGTLSGWFGRLASERVIAYIF